MTTPLPHRTKDRPPTKSDGTEVYAWNNMYRDYDRVPVPHVLCNQDRFTHWLSLDALPKPEEE